MKNSLIFLIVIIAAVATPIAHAAEWQWSVPVDDKGHTAYLWIPPTCQRVRGLFWGDQNCGEETLLQDPIIREAAAKAGLGLVWTTPKSFPWFKYKDGAAETLQKVLKELARVSGYSEIEFAPLIPMGHSASSPFAWYVGYWNPQCTIALISLKGAEFPAPDFDKEASIEGVPSLVITGEYYEHPTPDKSRFERWKVDRDMVIKMRRANDSNLCSLFVDVSRGHGDCTDDLAHIVAMYITKAAQYRLPPETPLDGPVTLRAIDPRSGWLMDPNAAKIKVPVTAPYAKYPGKPSEAAWYFDKEMAQAVASYGVDQKDKIYQMVGFVQDGNLLPITEHSVHLRFEPMENDDMSFKLTGAYLEQPPAMFVNQGSLHGHSSVPLRFYKMTGPVVQTGPDTFRLAFTAAYRTFPTDTCLEVYSLGDSKYRMAYQMGIMHVMPNTEGRKQIISFPKIDNVVAGTKSIELKATSDCNLPIQYYVKHGPAEIEGNRLVFTQIPPRSKFPVEVSVVANQWGHMREPKVQTAKPVEQKFIIEARSAKRP